MMRRSSVTPLSKTVRAVSNDFSMFALNNAVTKASSSYSTVVLLVDGSDATILGTIDDM